MIIEVLQICRREINFLLLAPKESSLDCTQPSTYKVIPRLRSNRPGIFELILSCHRRHFFSLLPCHSVSFFLSYRNIFSLPVIPACFFICHTGLRAGIQVNIDSLTTWIPGQARNDNYMNVIPRFRKKTSRDLRIPLFLSL